MSALTDRPYTGGNAVGAAQAEKSSANPNASSTDMRILIELQLISMLLYQQNVYSEDLGKMRQDIADSIT